MPAVGLANSTSDHGGTYTPTTTRTFVNGQLVLTVGALHHCPLEGHGTTEIIEGPGTTNVEGSAMARVGDAAGCGARITTGSLDVTDGD
jgi:uncharacterized Zn-binding protein involved in type VI secretion